MRVSRGEREPPIGGLCCALLASGFFMHSLITSDFAIAHTAKTGGLLYLNSVPWSAGYIIERRRFGNFAMAVPTYSRWPHYGYDLRLLPTDPKSGAAVCTECGCAWQLGGDVE
ncbi:MAG: hypothetical protein JSV78_04045 [Phycisphaerales bacterium]|nr:MAG: hypothetical protein JSV78_04045 [Phycisphaerales bacterium]